MDDFSCVSFRELLYRLFVIIFRSDLLHILISRNSRKFKRKISTHGRMKNGVLTLGLSLSSSQSRFGDSCDIGARSRRMRPGPDPKLGYRAVQFVLLSRPSFVFVFVPCGASITKYYGSDFIAAPVSIFRSLWGAIQLKYFWLEFRL